MQNNEFSFFSHHTFLKDVNWFSIPNPVKTLSLLHLFIQYGKNVPWKDLVLIGSGLIIEADDDLSKQFSWEEKSR